jgi:hypothetical protein
MGKATTSALLDGALLGCAVRSVVELLAVPAAAAAAL